MSKSDVIMGRSLKDITGSSTDTSFILKYRNPIVALIVVIIAGVLGYSYMLSQNAKKLENQAQKVFTFGQEVQTPFLKGEGTVENYAQQFSGLAKELDYPQTMLPLLLAAVEELKKKQAIQSVVELLKPFAVKYSSEKYLNAILWGHLAAFQEDLNLYSESYESLKKIEAAEFKFYETKLHFDLGRMAEKNGNKDAAKAHFSKAIEVAGEQGDEFKNLAKIYLEKM